MQPLPLGLPSGWAFCLCTHSSQARCATPGGSLLPQADGCLRLAKEALSSTEKPLPLQQGFLHSLAYKGLGVECWSLWDPRDVMEA